MTIAQSASTPTEDQVKAAWIELSDHGFACPACRPSPDRPQDGSSDCPTEWDLYRVWKRLWVEAGRPLDFPAEVPA